MNQLELEPKWVQPVIDSGSTQLNSMPNTCALARDWARMYAKVTERHGVRLADLETPRETVHEMIELAKHFISLCDAQEHFGGGYEQVIQETHAALTPLLEKYRLSLAQDWMRLHRVVGVLFSDTAPSV